MEKENKENKEKQLNWILLTILACGVFIGIDLIYAYKLIKESHARIIDFEFNKTVKKIFDEGK